MRTYLHPVINDRIGSMGKGNIFTGVCHLFTGRRVHPDAPPLDAPPLDAFLRCTSLWMHPPVDAPSWMYPWMYPFQWMHPLTKRQMVNRRAVRILLECILVSDSLAQMERQIITFN